MPAELDLLTASFSSLNLASFGHIFGVNFMQIIKVNHLRSAPPKICCEFCSEQNDH